MSYFFFSIGFINKYIIWLTLLIFVPLARTLQSHYSAQQFWILSFFLIVADINILNSTAKMEDSMSSFSKTAPSSFADYNQHIQTDHLVKWVLISSTADQMPLWSSSSPLGSTIKSIYSSNSLPYILHQMCPQTFPMRMSVTEMETIFMEYFQRQFGFYVKSLLVLEGRKQKMIVRLILYACIYSPHKEKFVANILKLDPESQQRLVNQIEQVEDELKQLKNWDKMVQIIKKLQTENNELAALLEECEETAQKHAQEIKSLQQELAETKKQLNLLVVEKRKILGNFSLSSLAEYEDLCLHLKVQNDELTKKQQSMTLMIRDLQKQVFLLQRGLNNSDIAITELNSQYYSLQKNYDEATRELSCIQESFTLGNESKIHCINKNLEATADMTMPSEIKPKKDSVRQNFGKDVFCNTNGSNFERKLSLGRSSRNSAAWNMFNTTKNNVLLSAKVQVFQETIEQQRLKIAELEQEICRLEDRQKHYLKKTRKIQKLSDGFQSQYQIISGRFPTVG